jgi:hypothetical protein
MPRSELSRETRQEKRSSHARAYTESSKRAMMFGKTLCSVQACPAKNIASQHSLCEEIAHGRSEFPTTALGTPGHGHGAARHRRSPRRSVRRRCHDDHRCRPPDALRRCDLARQTAERLRCRGLLRPRQRGQPRRRHGANGSRHRRELHRRRMDAMSAFDPTRTRNGDDCCAAQSEDRGTASI